MKTFPYIIGALTMIVTSSAHAEGYSALPLTIYNTRPSTVRYTVPRTVPVTTAIPVQEYTTTTVSTTPVVERVIERNTVQVVKQVVERPVYIDRIVERPVYRDRVVTRVVERPVYVAPRARYTRPVYTANRYTPYYSNNSYYPYSTDYRSNYSADYDYINDSFNTFNIDYTINSNNTGYYNPLHNYPKTSLPYYGKSFPNYRSLSYGYSNYHNSIYSSCSDSWAYLEGRC